MLAGIKKRIAHHHQAYSIRSLSHAEGPRIRLVSLPNLLIKKLLCFLLRVPCKLFATHWLACGEAAAIDGWGKNAVAKGKVTILPNAIDPERFKFSESARCEIRKQYGIKDDDFVIGHVGRFYPQKNHNFLIDVFSEVHKQKPNAKLLLLGDGPLQEKIREKTEILDIAESVVFAGLQKDPAPFYSAMDVFAFPSLWEGLPLTLVEAQYSGLPCMVSEHVTKEVEISSRLKCLPLIAEEWTKKIDSLYFIDSRNQMIANNYRFDIRTCYKMLESLYQIP